MLHCSILRVVWATRLFSAASSRASSCLRHTQTHTKQTHRNASKAHTCKRALRDSVLSARETAPVTSAVESRGVNFNTKRCFEVDDSATVFAPRHGTHSVARLTATCRSEKHLST